MTREKAFFLGGMIWLGVGMLLLIRGLNLINQILADPQAIFFLDRLGASGYQLESKVYATISLGFVIGFLKSNFAFRRIVHKNFNRLKKMGSVSLTAIYPRSSWMMMGGMMMLGMILKRLPIPKDIYSLVLIAVGTALMQGAVMHFRTIPMFKKQM